MAACSPSPSLVLVDDHRALRDGLAVLLERRGFRILAAADTAGAGEEAIVEHAPAVAVVDLDLPDESGIALIRRLVARGGSSKFLVYTGLTDPAALGEALDCGASGFVAKPGGLAVLVEGLREVFRGGSFRDPTLVKFSQLGESARARVLSRREAEILELLSTGFSGEEIAERLVLSPETIRTHVRNAMGKLEAKTRTEAVVKALERGEIRQG
ncbi:MAG TPA: response regulator transcription factor [Solirubrobacterales bacterium]|nr:response regulator transcription factor [Solirubrobacterales bacterium]